MKNKYLNLLLFFCLIFFITLTTYFTFFKNAPKNPGLKINNNYSKEEKKINFNNKEKENYKTKIFDLEFTEEEEDEEKPNLFLVQEVIDGDTFKLTDGKIVRLIGINTPEKGKPYFGEAKNYLKQLIEGKYVFLEKDISETDKYGRLLRYVWLPYDEEGYLLVNLELVNSGYAYSWSYPPDVLYSEELTEAQEEARINKRGLWQ